MQKMAPGEARVIALFSDNGFSPGGGGPNSRMAVKPSAFFFGGPGDFEIAGGADLVDPADRQQGRRQESVGRESHGRSFLSHGPGRKRSTCSWQLWLAAAA